MHSLAPSAIHQLIKDAHIPGLSMAVIRDRQPAALTAAGLRNALNGTAVDQRTSFAAASLSKPVFAYAVLQLVDAGKLALDTPLSRHVPDYVAGDPRAAAVTVQHVLSHTTGLPNWRSADAPLRTLFPPGERFGYSGEGFVWLQRVVEIVTGDPLETTLNRLIFAPLAMTSSSYTWQSVFDANYADPHDADGVPANTIRSSAPNIAATLQTNTEDYARFLQAVLSGTGLSRDTAQMWLAPQVDCDGGIAWGLGWGLEPASGTFFQWGDYDGGRFKAFAIGSLQQRSAMVVLTNGFHGMSIMPELVGANLPGDHPAFAWLGYSVRHRA